jgi:single-stranded DNA-binding protein
LPELAPPLNHGESLSRGSRVVVVGRLQQRSWTAEDGSARSTVEVVADELGPSLRWATATTTRMARSRSQKLALPDEVTVSWRNPGTSLVKPRAAVARRL